MRALRVEQNEDAIIGESYDSSEVKDAAHATLHTTIFLGCILTLSDPKARSYPKVENGLLVSLTLKLKFKKKNRAEKAKRAEGRAKTCRIWASLLLLLVNNKCSQNASKAKLGIYV